MPVNDSTLRFSLTFNQYIVDVKRLALLYCQLRINPKKRFASVLLKFNVNNSYLVDVKRFVLLHSQPRINPKKRFASVPFPFHVND